MLTTEQIEANKQRFCDIVNKIAEFRSGFNVVELLAYLEKIEFFTAPASLMTHSVYMGGLCEHSLNVYDTILCLIDMTYPDKVSYNEETGEELREPTCPYNWNVIATVALLHDVAKANYYKPSVRNEKIYCEGGSKSDQLGRFDWVSVPTYSKRDINEYFLYGSIEEDTVFKLQEFVKLSREEIVAMLHYSGYCADNFEKTKEYAYVYSKSSLSALLHIADEYATYICEISPLIEKKYE